MDLSHFGNTSLKLNDQLHLGMNRREGFCIERVEDSHDIQLAFLGDVRAIRDHGKRHMHGKPLLRKAL